MDSPTPWAAAAPYDSSCMDSRSPQHTPVQTPSHHRIMGYHTRNTQHTNSPQHRHTYSNPFPDITLSPITHTRDISISHIHDQTSTPAQMNESHPTIQLNPTHSHMNETLSQSTSYELNITYPTLNHLHMNDTNSQSQHSTYEHTQSHSFTHMNDTYLVVYDHTHDNNI